MTRFKKGDGVFSCTRLGAPGYGTFQEYVSLLWRNGLVGRGANVPSVPHGRGPHVQET